MAPLKPVLLGAWERAEKYAKNIFEVNLNFVPNTLTLKIGD